MQKNQVRNRKRRTKNLNRLGWSFNACMSGVRLQSRAAHLDHRTPGAARYSRIHAWHVRNRLVGRAGMIAETLAAMQASQPTFGMDAISRDGEQVWHAPVQLVYACMPTDGCTRSAPLRDPLRPDDCRRATRLHPLDPQHPSRGCTRGDHLFKMTAPCGWGTRIRT